MPVWQRGGQQPDGQRDDWACLWGTALGGIWRLKKAIATCGKTAVSGCRLWGW